MTSTTTTTTKQALARAGLGLGLAGLLAAAAPAMAADVNVGVSIGFSQPGVYGRIDIGSYPQPQVIAAQPVIIQRPSRVPPPVYLWVPPGHHKDWKKHCKHYNACGVPVYFVQDAWYQDQVVHGGKPGKGKGKGGDKDHGKSQGKGKHD